MNEANQIGKGVLLPSSHVGCRRYIIQNYHDGIAICRVYGPPDLFITFTCNPMARNSISNIRGTTT